MTSISRRIVYTVFVTALILFCVSMRVQARKLNQAALKRSEILQLSYALPQQTPYPPQDQAKRDAAYRATQQAEQLREEGSADSLKKAVQKYDEALLLYRAMSDRGYEASTLSNLGAVYYRLGEMQKAIEVSNLTLAICREVQNRFAQATALSNLGLVYRDLGEKQKALDHFTQALELRRDLGDRAGQARMLTNLGLVYGDLGEKQKAIDYFNQALRLRRGAGDLYGEAASLKNLGKIYDDLGEKEKAADYFNQASQITNPVSQNPIRDRANGALANLHGSILREEGTAESLRKAAEKYNEALSLFRAVGDRGNQAFALTKLGQIYDALDEMQKALECFNQALLLHRALDDSTGEATALNNIGKVYSDLGAMEKALGHYKQALLLWRAVGNRAGEATTLSNIGLVYDDLGEKENALNYYNQALGPTREVGDRSGEARTLNNLCSVYHDLGENQKALDCFNRALPLTVEVGDLAAEGATLSNLGRVYYALGQKQKAFDYYHRALSLRRALGDRKGEAMTLSNLMDAWTVNNTAVAIFYGKQAVNTYQQLRVNISGLDKALQKSFLHSKEKTYRRLADLLISRGRLPEAQQVLRLLKEQEYFEFVRGDASVSALLQRSDLTPEEAAAVERYNKVADEITKLAGEFSALKDAGVSPTDARYQTLRADIEAANRSFQVKLRQIADEFGKESQKGKGIVKELQENKGLQSDLKKWGSGVVALYTVLGEENYHVILTTPTLQVARAAEPKIKAVALNKLVLEFREAVESRNTDPRPLGQRLYKILIAPVEKDLEAAGAKTIVWSLDGTLRYLPIAALYDGQQYFAERYQNVIITLASRTRLNNLTNNDWRGLGLGVSKGIVKEWGVFRPLPSVPSELRGIIREENELNVTAGILPGKVMLDETFTEEAMERALGEGRYPLVHIASHFQFKPGNETNSFLLLGDGNRLTLDKIRIAASPFFGGVELLTLSACDTATGGDANGREVESFAVLAQEQGAQAVLATLWPVADESTKLLMEKFYQNRITKPGMTKVEALRQAQLALLLGKTGPEASFAHPYFWAPFILIGNWK